MLSKEEKYILSLLKKGDVVWQDIGGGLTALKHVNKIITYKWWFSPIARSVYGEYAIWYREQYTTLASRGNSALPLGGEHIVKGVHMVTSSTGQIKYIDVKKFLKCMKENNYFLSTKTLGENFVQTLVDQLPEYAQRELEKLTPYDEEMVVALDNFHNKTSSRCCK